MGITFHPDGGILIDDPEIEQIIAEMCEITGEPAETAVMRAIEEALEHRKTGRVDGAFTKNSQPESSD